MDKLPVLAWIYGGFFMFGSINRQKYDGRYLSNVTNAIVVSVNYRVSE